jgi:ferritin
MFSERLLKELNQQIRHEFYSAHFYLAMAAYLVSEDLDGFANFFKVQAEEEKFHAMKFFDFVNEMDGRVILYGIDEPLNEFNSVLDVFQKAYLHEKKVTQMIYNLMDIATEEKDYKTTSFLKWFIDEQVEEEAMMKSIIKKLERIGDNSSALYMLDTELGQRTFTPPTDQTQK